MAMNPEKEVPGVEQRAAKAEEKKKNGTAEEGDVFRAVKFIFVNRQLRWILIAGFLFFATTFYTSYYATVLEGAMSTESVANVLIIYPFLNGIGTIASGFFSDRLGRKTPIWTASRQTPTGKELWPVLF